MEMLALWSGLWLSPRAAIVNKIPTATQFVAFARIKVNKNSNVNSTTSEKDKNYYERWKIAKVENKKLMNLLEDTNITITNKIKQYKQETELLTNLLLEVLPVVKGQLKLEDYQSTDFRKTGDNSWIKAKEKLLTKIRMLKTSKGFNTASTDDDSKLKSKLENANKTIEVLRNREKSLVNRISSIERSEISLRSKYNKIIFCVEIAKFIDFGYKYLNK